MFKDERSIVEVGNEGVVVFDGLNFADLSVLRKLISVGTLYYSDTGTSVYVYTECGYIVELVRVDLLQAIE